MSWSRNCPHWVTMWLTSWLGRSESGWKVRLTSLARGSEVACLL